MLLKAGGESNQHLYRHSLNCGGFRPATTPNGEYSPVMDSNGTCLDVVRYFSRLQSCATWSVQDLPDSRIKPQVSVLITSEECVPSVPLPGWSYVCWVEHVNSSLFSKRDLKLRETDCLPEGAFLEMLIKYTQLCLVTKRYRTHQTNLLQGSSVPS